jgi:biopolymer transport protein ExbB/TolQ
MNTLLLMGKVKARLILAFSMILLGITVIIIISTIEDPIVTSILIDSEATYYPITIQNFMWIFFFLGIGELIYRFMQGQYIYQNLKLNMLPDDETMIFTKNETQELYKNIKDRSNLPDDLPNLLKKLIMNFQATASIAQVQELFSLQMDLKYNQTESDYSMIKYITWLIPTLGFIGTVIGISLALNYASLNDPQAATFLSGLTAKLSVAFYTTLVGLVMSSILVFIMYVIMNYEEGSLYRQEEYVLDNLINKLYIK